MVIKEACVGSGALYSVLVSKTKGAGQVQCRRIGALLQSYNVFFPFTLFFWHYG